MSMPEGEEEISVYVRCRWFGTTLDEFRTGQGGAAFRGNTKGHGVLSGLHNCVLLSFLCPVPSPKSQVSLLPEDSGGQRRS